MSAETVSILEGDTFVVSDRRGDVVPSPTEPRGLFHQDTRFLSCWRLTINGHSPRILSTDDVNYFSSQFFLVPPAETFYDDASISIIRKRSVGDGFHEDITVLNHTGEESGRPASTRSSRVTHSARRHRRSSTGTETRARAPT